MTEVLRQRQGEERWRTGIFCAVEYSRDVVSRIIADIPSACPLTRFPAGSQRAPSGLRELWHSTRSVL